MKIAVDAMGGDYAPEEIVKGVVLALEERDLEITLLGNKIKLEEEIEKYKSVCKMDKYISIIHCQESVATSESPLNALRSKKDSSILVGMNLLKKNEADAFVSAGHSGAIMAGALLVLGCLSKLPRPAIPAVLPTSNGKVLILDVGANVDCKPAHLVQFALMGSKYAQHIFKINNPKIGLLNIGEEENKGNKLTRSTYKILKSQKLNFIGNIEGKDIFKGKVDVVVCDGFIGNILLKSSEGLAKFLMMEINNKVKERLPLVPEAVFLKQEFMQLAKITDYTEYGGSLLLGVKGLCFICHGRSKAKAIKNAIINATKFINSDILQQLELEES